MPNTWKQAKRMHTELTGYRNRAYVTHKGRYVGILLCLFNW